MTVKKTETLDPDFLSNSDKDFLMELITEWLSENNVEDVEEIAYSIKVEWTEQS